MPTTVCMIWFQVLHIILSAENINNLVNNERTRRESYHRRKIQTAKNIIILSKKNLDRPTNLLMKRRIELQFEGFHPLHLCQCIIEYSQEPEQMGEFVRILQDRARAQLTDRPSVWYLQIPIWKISSLLGKPVRTKMDEFSENVRRGERVGHFRSKNFGADKNGNFGHKLPEKNAI